MLWPLSVPERAGGAHRLLGHRLFSLSFGSSASLRFMFMNSSLNLLPLTPPLLYYVALPPVSLPPPCLLPWPRLPPSACGACSLSFPFLRPSRTRNTQAPPIDPLGPHPTPSPLPHPALSPSFPGTQVVLA